MSRRKNPRCAACGVRFRKALENLRRMGSGRSFGFDGALKGGIVTRDEVSKREWNRLMKSGWRGMRGDDANQLHSPRRHRVGSATSPNSPGGRSITPDEMSQLLDKQARTMARLMQAGMADAPNLRAFARSLDNSMGGYFEFRNGMGAEPQ